MLFLIPARGGSKRLPGKNLKELAGIPLVAHAIRRAQGAARILGGEHRVVVSTDSQEIAEVSRQWGAEVLMRPAELAEDDAPSIWTLMHAQKVTGEEYAALLQPTSPLCTAEDVAEAVVQWRAAYTGGDPAWGAYTTGDGERPNGAAYLYGKPNGIGYARVVVDMPASRSIDIDTEDDWHMAEALLAARPVAEFPLLTPGRCFVIAEAGVNHNGDWDTAHRLIDAAAAAGADAVKFQGFVPERLAEPGPHLDMLKRLECPIGSAMWVSLAAWAAKKGVIFLSSVFDEQSVDFLDPLLPAFKIPSGEIVNEPLLRHVASKGKPVILSTGMSTMLEVARAVDALAGVPLALLHCVSAYPADPRTANLRAMDTLRMAFGVPVGWSDHTLARNTAVAAVARGACIVEKHLTLDTTQEGPDHAASADPACFAKMVRGIRITEAALGDGVKAPTPAEMQTAAVARRKDGLRRAS